jgi:class 3 adenylate cyclase/tetratricopeptide (TPR) repeat protein
MDVRSERRLVTCLFVDVVGSTDVTARLGPERMQRLLRDAFAEMSATIADHGGTIETYVGDAIFALFGAPTAHADDAERALRAAEACASWSAAPTALNARLAVRIGLETGEALVDLGGVDQHQRMAVGDCVNTAARLQQHAAPGEIVVGPACHDATRGTVSFEPLGPVTLKGLGQIEAWRFAGFRASPAIEQLAFVGRDAELTILCDAFARASSGAATLALIVGPPGQGKSRLAGEAIRTCSTMRILHARCRPGAETGLNTPLRQLVNSDVPDATPASVRDRLSALLGSEGIDAAAAICHSAGLAVDERLFVLGRIEQRELIADAWRRYLAAIAREGPMIAWIEDIHWADPVLLRIIDHVTSDLQAPAMVIATARPEFIGSAHLRPRENRIQINLEPLGRGPAEQLARMAGDDRGDTARAAGNPLFIIELARSRSAPDQMPVTIQAAIAARLDELSPAERDLLQKASVAGETFDVRDAALLSDREPAEVAGALGRIAHLGFVVPVDSRYRFSHVLVREVAYGRLPVAERMTLHARYAVDGVDPADVEALAHHWWEALKPADAQWVWDEPASLSAMRLVAMRAHLAAGRRLEERNAYEESLEVYTRALELADEAHDIAEAEASVGRAYARQSRGDEAWQHRLLAIDQYGRAGLPVPSELYADMLEIATLNWGFFQHLPDDAEVLRLLGEGERIARSSGDSVALARLGAERAAFTNDLGGTDAIDGFVESPDGAQFADAAHRTAQMHVWNGQITRGIRLYEAVFERLIPAGGVVNDGEALLWYSVAALNGGDLAKAEELSARLARLAAHRSPHTRQHAFALAAFLHLARGAWDEVSVSAQGLKQLVEANPETGFCLLGAYATGYGAIADLLAGRSIPADLDAHVARIVDESVLIQASSVMVPKVMANVPGILPGAMAAYAPDLRLWDRARVWDICDLMPAIALTMREQWDELGPSLARLDAVAAGGGRVAGGVAAAIREEEAAARGGPASMHEELRALGCAGISQLLRFRPTPGDSPH